jgi:hypothetical protein
MWTGIGFEGRARTATPDTTAASREERIERELGDMMEADAVQHGLITWQEAIALVKTPPTHSLTAFGHIKRLCAIMSLEPGQKRGALVYVERGCGRQMKQKNQVENEVSPRCRAPSR